MLRGGPRPGAGRKSKLQITTMRSLLDSEIPAAQWQALIRCLMESAERGNLAAAKILLSYRFGNPYEKAPAEDATRVIDALGSTLDAPGLNSSLTQSSDQAVTQPDAVA